MTTKIKALIHILSLILGYFIGLLLFNDSVSIETLSALFAWWFSLYIGYIFKIYSDSAIWISILFVCISAIDFLFSLNLLQDNSSSNLFGHILVSSFGWLIIISPVFVNHGITKIKSKLTKGE